MDQLQLDRYAYSQVHGGMVSCSLMKVCVHDMLLPEGSCTARPGPKHFLTRFLLCSNKKHATMDTIAYASM